MIRRVIWLALEAAKVEIDRWLQPEPAGASEPAPTQPTPTGWDPETYLARLTAESRCPFCAKPKPAGVLMCKPCDDVREPLRKKAAAAAKTNVQNSASGRPTRTS